MSKNQTFWDHLDDLRRVLFRNVLLITIVAVVLFCFKEALFGIILAPQSSDFVTYRLFDFLAEKFDMPTMKTESFHTQLISTQLTTQFMMHMKVTFYAAFMIASPFVIYQLFHYISPALYAKERRYSRIVLIWSAVFFLAGILLSYYIIFPFTFRFLSEYQISTEIQNFITIDSYIDTLVMISLLMGIMFEIPVIAWLSAKLGFVNSKLLRKYRRHACIAILVIAAIITPTTDIFTLLLVSAPIGVLYELSIWIVKREEKRHVRE